MSGIPCFILRWMRPLIRDCVILYLLDYELVELCLMNLLEGALSFMKCRCNRFKRVTGLLSDSPSPVFQQNGTSSCEASRHSRARHAAFCGIHGSAHRFIRSI